MIKPGNIVRFHSILFFVNNDICEQNVANTCIDLPSVG